MRVVTPVQLPSQFDIETIQELYPTTYQDSMNTVLVQEAIRYNALLDVLDSSLRSTLKALEGTVVMSPDLEKVANSLYDNQVRSSRRALSARTVREKQKEGVSRVVAGILGQVVEVARGSPRTLGYWDRLYWERRTREEVLQGLSPGHWDRLLQ